MECTYIIYMHTSETSHDVHIVLCEEVTSHSPVSMLYESRQRESAHERRSFAEPMVRMTSTCARLSVCLASLRSTSCADEYMTKRTASSSSMSTNNSRAAPMTRIEGRTLSLSQMCSSHATQRIHVSGIGTLSGHQVGPCRWRRDAKSSTSMSREGVSTSVCVLSSAAAPPQLK